LFGLMALVCRVVRQTATLSVDKFEGVVVLFHDANRSRMTSDNVTPRFRASRWRRSATGSATKTPR